ncbi:hypothetical protein DFH09DRAFT_1393618 [Mycena vulgaris]|nr:hypothetical protein DFH09DRAFT_1393618 [Mycena vulgaris]
MITAITTVGFSGARKAKLLGLEGQEYSTKFNQDDRPAGTPRISTTTTFGTVYSAFLVFVTQTLSMRRNLQLNQMLTATHDNATAWTGIGSAVFYVWRQRARPASTLGVVAICLYLGNIMALHITTPALFSVETFDSSRSVVVSTQSLLSWHWDSSDFANTSSCIPTPGLSDGRLYDAMAAHSYGAGNTTSITQAFNITAWNNSYRQDRKVERQHYSPLQHTTHRGLEQSKQIVGELGQTDADFCLSRPDFSMLPVRGPPKCHGGCPFGQASCSGPRIDKSSSAWLPYNGPSPAGPGDDFGTFVVTGNILIDAWALWHSVMPPSSIPLDAVKSPPFLTVADQYPIHALNLLPSDPRDRPNSVTLHQVENALSSLVATTLWTIGHSTPMTVQFVANNATNDRQQKSSGSLPGPTLIPTIGEPPTRPVLEWGEAEVVQLFPAIHLDPSHKPLPISFKTAPTAKASLPATWLTSMSVFLPPHAVSLSLPCTPLPLTAVVGRLTSQILRCQRQRQCGHGRLQLAGDIISNRCQAGEGHIAEQDVEPAPESPFLQIPAEPEARANRARLPFWGERQRAGTKRAIMKGFDAYLGADIFSWKREQIVIFRTYSIEIFFNALKLNLKVEPGEGPLRVAAAMPPTTTRAALPELRAADRSLYDILLSWKHDESDEAPMLLACLLRHKYSEIPDFCAESLQGRDAALVSHLRPIARKLNFRMLLAQIDYTVSTEMQADDDDDDEDGCRRYGDYYGNNDNDDEEIDEYCFEAVGVPHESLYFGPTVNLDGIPVEVELDLKPEDLLNGGNVTNDVADERTFERDDRTEATRTEVYKRTILLLWPKNSPLDSTIALGDAYDYACNALHKSTTTAVTRREKLLVDSLLGSCETPHPKRPQRAVQVLAKSARRWDDIHLLLRTLKACGVDKNTGLLGVEGFVSCSKTFGWDALKDFCNDAMTNEESNIRRDALLARLTQMSVEQPDPSLSLWCQDHEETSLRSLRKVTTAQLPALVERALARGGVFLRDIILPQLQTQKLSAIGWMLFVANFHKRLPPNPPPGDAAVFRELKLEVVLRASMGLADSEWEHGDGVVKRTAQAFVSDNVPAPVPNLSPS